MHAFDKLHEECGVFGIYLRDGKTGVVPTPSVPLTSTGRRSLAA